MMNARLLCGALGVVCAMGVAYPLPGEGASALSAFSGAAATASATVPRQYLEPFAVAPSQGAQRVEVSCYVSPERVCTRGYKKPTKCLETSPARRWIEVRYVPASPPRRDIIFNLGGGQYVRVFTRSWYAGDAMPGVGGAGTTLVVYPSGLDDSVQLQIINQPKCEGCQ